MKKESLIKISLSTFLLIIALIVIVIMGVYIYKTSNYNNTESDKTAELESQIGSLNSTVTELQSESMNGYSNSDSSEPEEKSELFKVIGNDTNTKTNNLNNEIETTSKKNIDYDTIIEISELEKINYSNDALLKSIEKKYKNKIVKITGYVSGNGLFEEGYTVSIGGLNNYKDYTCATGILLDENTINTAKKLKIGQKISIIGTAMETGTNAEGTWPMVLNNAKIVVE